MSTELDNKIHKDVLVDLNKNHDRLPPLTTIVWKTLLSSLNYGIVFGALIGVLYLLELQNGCILIAGMFLGSVIRDMGLSLQMRDEWNRMRPTLVAVIDWEKVERLIQQEETKQ